jgi:hypothetical protein
MDELGRDLELQQRALTMLRETERDLDPQTLDQLAAARRAAVASADSSTPWLSPWLLGFGGTAATAALVLAIALTSVEPELPPLDQIEFAVAQETELLEDLEFVAWMMLEDGVELEDADDVSASS